MNAKLRAAIDAGKKPLHTTDVDPDNPMNLTDCRIYVDPKTFKMEREQRPWYDELDSRRMKIRSHTPAHHVKTRRKYDPRYDGVQPKTDGSPRLEKGTVVMKHLVENGYRPKY